MLLITDRFSPEARPLRKHFEERFADPRSADSGRFVWDYWHVPGQYTALRTPAYHFFPKGIYEPFHRRLVEWGRKNLGCHDISPPWMSCYVDGCRQELHGDLPHGPWAFVFSLTPWETRRFIGGETLLMKAPILDYWRNLDRYPGLEEGEVFQAIPAKFNRLTVFDPRVPHGVRRVEGAWDPREGRLVIHGWFVQPRPFIEGALPRAELQRAIDRVIGNLGQAFGGELPLRGVATFRFHVGASGSVTRCEKLANTLVAQDGDERLIRALNREVLRSLQSLQFKKQKGIAKVTLPLIFEA